MTFNSIDYLAFFPVVFFFYFLLPNKIRMYWLLISSYYFYMSWNAKYGILLFSSTLITYLCGLGIEKVRQNNALEGKKKLQKLLLCISVIINIGLLLYYKYAGFLIDNLNLLLQKLGISLNCPRFDIVLPIGISFFTFQAVGYTIDVYRGEIQAEKNLFRYALFVSFFPQLVAGPIERSKNLLNQLRSNTRFDVNNAKTGLLIMAYGLFMKVVVADNISNVIDPIFSSPTQHAGMTILFATILFAFQIYCDFNGYTQIAIGSARVLGFTLNQNFDTPYMARSIKDFWRRWHISLTSWFRDYLYIPLGGNKRGKLRKQINTMIVYLCSGLWHGAAWHYVAWGLFNGIFSVVEDVIMPFYKRFIQRFSIITTSFMYVLFQRIITFILIDFTWLFFRAENLESAISMLKQILHDFNLAWILNCEFTSVFSTPYQLMTVFIPVFLIISIDAMKYAGKDFADVVFRQQIVFRWVIYIVILLSILYWGGYGSEYVQTQFIYFQF